MFEGLLGRKDEREEGRVRMEGREGRSKSARKGGEEGGYRDGRRKKIGGRKGGREAGKRKISVLT